MVNKVTEDSCLQREGGREGGREGEREKEKGRGEAHRNCSISRSISSLTFYTISLGVNKACT